MEGRIKPDARVNQQHLFTADQIQCMFNLELEIGEALDTPRGQGLLGMCRQALDKNRAQGIVAPTRVAPAQHQPRRHRGAHGRSAACGWQSRRVSPLEARCTWSITAPLVSRSVTDNGICPSAWVAQDRQGS